jgi:hypothetical protein
VRREELPVVGHDLSPRGADGVKTTLVSDVEADLGVN